MHAEPQSAYGMRMGNLLCPRAPVDTVMAANRPTFGIAHRTVVPTNFERSTPTGDDERTAADRDA